MRKLFTFLNEVILLEKLKLAEQNLQIQSD